MACLAPSVIRDIHYALGLNHLAAIRLLRDFACNPQTGLYALFPSCAAARNDSSQPPRLELGNRPALDDLHDVADFGFVLLVVDVQNALALKYFPYFGCFIDRSIRTLIVLSWRSDSTTAVRVRRSVRFIGMHR